MLRILLLLAMLLPLLPLSSSGQSVGTPVPLVSRYGSNASNGKDAYRPRSFNLDLLLPDVQRNSSTVPNATWKIIDCEPFCGWDVFGFGATGGSFTAEVSDTWATFQTSRPTVVGYVHRQPGSAPSWITSDGWTLTGTVDARIQDPRNWTDPRPVYTKSFPAGTVTIKSPSGYPTTGPKILPWILFAEAGGLVSTPPSVPAGQALPAPNQTCPEWVHNQSKYRAGSWASWHPPIDPVYWCYFRHDHGSNPRHVYPANDGGPRYGEIANQMGMTENHWGHKNYVVEYPHEGVVIMFVHHFGTFGIGRVNTCMQRHHLVEVHVRTMARTQTLYIGRFMGDFGRSILTFGVAQNGDTIDPPTCPDGNAATGYTTTSPSRLIPDGEFATRSDAAYEPWNLPVNRYLDSLGIGGNFVFNTVDILTAPVDESATEVVEIMTRSGTGRFFTPNNMSIHCPTNLMNSSGHWWTNALGDAAVTSTTPGAVRQYCNPAWDGFEAMTAGSPTSAHMGGANVARWGDMTIPVPSGIPGDAEGSITASHGPNVEPVLVYASEVAR